MTWVIIICIVIAIFLGRFIVELIKDNKDLQDTSLPEKFKLVVDIINDSAFNGNGVIKVVNKRRFTLYQHGENQIIIFEYSTGNLNIQWRYKYLQQEVVHERLFDDARNYGIIEQERIASHIVEEMHVIIVKHINSISRF